jgi:peptide/nickel transport system substrate-binding protein
MPIGGSFVRKIGTGLTVVCLTVLASVAIAACGSSGGGGGGGKKGGSIRIGSVLPDSYDPVLFQTVQANQALQLVYKGLVTYKDAPGPEGGKLIPAVAEKMPTISSDGKTYKFRVRKGLTYSDGTPVKASDFEHSIKRLLFLGGPFSSFMSGIVGADKYTAAKKENADISGIVNNDKTGDITIKLTKPNTQFLFAAALANAAPTPAAKSPFKKSTPPGAGPYTIQVVNPSRELILTKNPRFDVPGVAKGNIDKITAVKETVPKMTQDVISGKLDFMTEDPTGDLLPQVEAKYKDRFRLDSNPPNTYWFFMNRTTKPFDKKEVREAVNWALDSRALQRVFGGRLEPSCNFLPSAYKDIGYKKIDPCPWGDPNGPPNIAKAKQLVAKSGYKGMNVTVWGSNKEPRPAIVDYYRDLLNQIGFKAKTRILDQQVYFGTIGNRSTKAQTGFTDYFQDFPHPNDMYEPNLSKAALASNPSFNFEFSADPVLDKKAAELKQKDPSKVADQWAAVDRQIIEKGDLAVYGSEKSSSFFSERMDFKNCAGVHVTYKSDWALFCLK